MRPRHIWQYTLGLVVAASVVACGGGGEQSTSEKPSSPSATPSGQKVDTATAGNVTGTVMLEGTAPANEPIKMNADPVCMKENKGTQLQETFVADSSGALGNVFVYVKDGLGNYVFDTPTEPLTLDQKGCRYHPHVMGIRVNQPMQIVNSDPTLHNIHALGKANPEFNNGQPIQGMKMTHTFTAKEVMLPFKCDVHGWMNAYLGVLDHPYFAVTGTDGKFEIKTLPPGTYTIEAWHEKLGTATEKVTLTEKENKEVMFRFKAPGAATD
jgi:plastocyanin